jgi:hypothetical protein
VNREIEQPILDIVRDGIANRPNAIQDVLEFRYGYVGTQDVRDAIWQMIADGRLELTNSRELVVK